MIIDTFRSLALLRHPEVRTILGELRLKQLALSAIRLRNAKAKLSDDIEWIAYEPDRMSLGELVTVCRGTIMAFGDEKNGFGRISVGPGSWIGQYNNLRACGYGGDISIGANCLVSQFCTLVGSNHAIDRDKLIIVQGPDISSVGVVIEDDVWLGSGVVVMPGVVVSKGAVIGANSVVTGNVHPYEIWAGCPAKKIGERT
jgi:acetyltransferase-like isoleucine patch superfamily enzyme